MASKTKKTNEKGIAQLDKELEETKSNNTKINPSETDVYDGQEHTQMDNVSQSTPSSNMIHQAKLRNMVNKTHKR